VRTAGPPVPPTVEPSPAGDSRAGEREFLPRRPGRLFAIVKRISWIELVIFAGLLVVWLGPGMQTATFWFGLAHGIGFLILCAVMWVAVLRREAPFWLLAATVTPFGPIGSTLGVLVIERRRSDAATP
jgi:hypothetical protein